MKIVPINQRKKRSDYFDDKKQEIQRNKRKQEPEEQKHVKIKENIKKDIENKM